MAKKRPEMTSVDYVVIALSPFLIMVLVGSLCFFLLEVGYRGQFTGRLHWILFWFVVGTVGIARISMEEGSERASLYGLGLAGAVAVAVLRFVDSPWITWGLMALSWWCAHKLTWDCTLIDDEQDASGEGLLQVAGLEEGIGDAGAKTPGDQQDADEKPKRSSWWQRLLESPEERRKRPHAPGVWVVYFSLAALPLFGLGQAFIPAADVERRRQAFWLLVWYVGSGMGLLLTTSFLGLRRYLRQRKLEMPLTMTGAWLGVGAVLIVALVLVTMLVPRPSPEYPVENLIANAISSPLRSASRYAPLRDSGVEQGPPGAPGTSSDAGQGGAQQGGGQQSGGRDKETRGQGDKESGQQSGGQQSGGQQSGGRDKETRGQGDKESGQQSGGQQSGGQQSGGQQSAGQHSGGQHSGGQHSGGQQSGGQQSGGQQSGGQQSGGQQSGGQQRGGQQSGGQQSGGQQSGGQQSGRQQSSGQQSGGQQSGGQQSGGQQSGGQQSGGQQSGGQQGDGQDKETRGQGDKENEQQGGAQSSGASNPESPTPNPQSPTPSPQSPTSRLPNLSQFSLATWIRWLMWAALAAAALVAFLRFRNEVLAFVRQLWAELLSLFNGLFGGRKTRASDAVQPETMREPPRPFSAFRNPFYAGKADRISPEQLVRYTFEALEAWTFERAAERRREETPLEFAAALSERFPPIASDARQLALVYSQMIYARTPPSRDSLPVLRRLWDEMSRSGERTGSGHPPSTVSG